MGIKVTEVAADQGKTIDVKAIEKKLGIPVLLFSATDGKKYEPYYETMEAYIMLIHKILHLESHSIFFWSIS